VRIVPETVRPGELAPSYRILVDCAEIGAGRTKTLEGGRAYIALKLDDPSFAEPIYANLFEDPETKKFVLFWSRQTEQDGG
jgi:uncharacterized protein (DUF736 family)